MILLECFDRESVENIAACLRLKPEKVIFLGDGEQMEGPLKRYRRFFAARGLEIQVTACHVRMEDIHDIMATLRYVLRSGEDYVIDITGGDEQLVLAVGMVMGQMPEADRRRVQIQKLLFGLEQGMDADGDGRMAALSREALSVEEIIALHGGIVHPDTEQPGKQYSPGDVEPLWNAMCADRKEWNKAVMALNEFESRCDSDRDIELRLEVLRERISRFEEKERRLRWLLEKLSRCGVIDDRSSGEVIRYSYRDPLLRTCAQKAGNVLEIKTLLEARAMKDGQGPYFDDCVMGVNIDWDGIVFNPAQRVPETRNEIDVLVTRGMRSLFISCKNGEIGEEELYKLNTVARRFGGKYARKMLIATELDRKGQGANQAFLQRAEDMGIHVIRDAAAMTSAQWHRALRQAMEE
jgi:hypothetical protein